MMKLDIQMFASTNKTANYELPQFVGTDKPTWLGDFNEAMADIDAGMHENATSISSMASDVQTATSTASQASQDVSGLTSTVNTLSSTVSSVQTTANNASQTASSALNTANTANGKADTNATNIATNTSDIANLNTSIGNLNDDLDELTTDVQLYGSHASSYTHNITLLDDALKFREMIVITGVADATGDTNNSVILPIINGTIYSGGTTSSAKWINVNVAGYVQNTKALTLKTSAVTSASSDTSVAIVAIYGRK